MRGINKNRFLLDAHVCVLFKIQFDLYVSVCVCVCCLFTFSICTIYFVSLLLLQLELNMRPFYTNIYTRLNHNVFAWFLFVLSAFVCQSVMAPFCTWFFLSKPVRQTERERDRSKKKEKKIVNQTTDAISVKRLLNLQSILNKFIHSMASHIRCEYDRLLISLALLLKSTLSSITLITSFVTWQILLSMCCFYSSIPFSTDFQLKWVCVCLCELRD